MQVAKSLAVGSLVSGTINFTRWVQLSVTDDHTGDILPSAIDN